MGEGKAIRCGCGCGEDFVPTRKWSQFKNAAHRWEAWILDKAAAIKRARKAKAKAK